MQATLPLAPSHPVKSLLGLARQIALPHEHAPLRFPSFPALERTALMGFTYPTTIALPANQTVKVLTFRQAAYPVWADRTVNGTSWTVGWEGDPPGAGGYVKFSSGLAGANSGNATATAYTPGVTTSQATLPYPPLGADQGLGPLPFVYVPAGFNYVVVAVSGSGSGVTSNSICTVDLEAWSSPGEARPIARQTCAITTPNYSGSSGSILNNTAAWIRPTGMSVTAGILAQYNVFIIVSAGVISFTATSGNAGTATISGADVRTTLPLAVPSEFANSQLPWFAARTTAASFLGTNVSQVLYKGGTLLGGRISPNVYNAWTVPYNYVSGLHPAEKAFLPLETGVYTYVPPSTDMSNFFDYTSAVPLFSMNSAGTTASVPLFRLDNDSMYHVVFLSASATDEQLACTIDWHIEFRTSSALFQIGMSTMTLESLHQAQLALAELGYFFENPDHKKLAAKVQAVAKKYGPAVLKGAMQVAPPQVRMAAKLGQMLISSKPKPTPPASSAKAAGIVPATKGSQPKRAGKKKKK